MCEIRLFSLFHSFHSLSLFIFVLIISGSEIRVLLILFFFFVFSFFLCFKCMKITIRQNQIVAPFILHRRRCNQLVKMEIKKPVLIVCNWFIYNIFLILNGRKNRLFAFWQQSIKSFYSMNHSDRLMNEWKKRTTKKPVLSMKVKRKCLVNFFCFCWPLAYFNIQSCLLNWSGFSTQILQFSCSFFFIIRTSSLQYTSGISFSHSISYSCCLSPSTRIRHILDGIILVSVHKTNRHTYLISRALTTIKKKSFNLPSFSYVQLMQNRMVKE